MRIEVLRKSSAIMTLVVIHFCVVILSVVPAGGHVGSPQLTDDCGACHVGHGQSGEPMLAKSEEDFCYQCHGSDQERSRMIAEGWLLPSARLVDMRQEFEKQFIVATLRTNEGNLSRSAQSLGVHRNLGRSNNDF